MPGRLVSLWALKLLEFRHPRVQGSYVCGCFAREPPSPTPDIVGAGGPFCGPRGARLLRVALPSARTPQALGAREILTLRQGAPFWDSSNPFARHIESFLNLWRNVRVVSCQAAICRTAQTRWTHWDLNPGPSACEADVMPLHHVPPIWSPKQRHRP